MSILEIIVLLGIGGLILWVVGSSLINKFFSKRNISLNHLHNLLKKGGKHD